MSVVITTLHAGAQFGTRSALRAQVKKHLEGVLGVALEMKQLPGGHVPRDAQLVARVDGHDVSYSLDVENGCATIVSVDLAGIQASAIAAPSSHTARALTDPSSSVHTLRVKGSLPDVVCVAAPPRGAGNCIP